jgi:hypothetical protein
MGIIDTIINTMAIIFIIKVSLDTIATTFPIEIMAITNQILTMEITIRMEATGIIGLI